MALEVKGSGRTEAPRKYIGVTPVKVIAINPTREELEAIYGKALEKEPQYIFDKDGKRNVLINIWLKSTNEVDGRPIIFNQLKIWISDSIVLFKTREGQEKCRVIDDYGECCTLSSAEFQAGMVPPTSRVVGNFRPTKRGEETLVSFIKAWMDVQNSTEWNKADRKWVPVSAEKLADAKITYDWQQWIDGDWSDLKALVEANKDRLMQVAVGLELHKKGDEKTWYQTVFTDYFMRGWETNYGYMQKQIERFMDGETSVIDDETAKTYKRVPRKGIYQFNSDWIRVWEQPVAKFNQGDGGMPPMEEAVKTTKAEEPKSDWDKFIGGQKTEKTASSVNGLPPMPENFVPDESMDLPF